MSGQKTDGPILTTPGPYGAIDLLKSDAHEVGLQDERRMTNTIAIITANDRRPISASS